MGVLMSLTLWVCLMVLVWEQMLNPWQTDPMRAPIAPADRNRRLLTTGNARPSGTNRSMCSLVAARGRSEILPKALVRRVALVSLSRLSVMALMRLGAT